MDVGVVSSFSSGHITGDMIKGRAQVVDCVSDTKSISGADWFCALHAYDVSSCVKIGLSKNSIAVSVSDVLGQKGLELSIHVAYGPSNF